MSVDLWLQAGLAGVVAGLITGLGAFFGTRVAGRRRDRDAAAQREVDTQREEWWRRFTWASELAAGDSERSRVTGLDLLTELAQSSLATPGDCLLMDSFHRNVLDSEELPAREAIR